MYELLASPFLSSHLVIRPGRPDGLKIPAARYAELRQASQVPAWLADAAQHAWGIQLHGRAAPGALLVREPAPYGFGRASYELNLGCEHCYLGLKTFDGLAWDDRDKLLHAIRDSGVLWLQLTGGEPMIDRLFTDVYARAFELGLVLTILSNGSRLWHPKVLDLLATARPHRITLSVYGATEASYDGLTRRKGAFRLFRKGLLAAHEAGLPLALSMIVTRHNAHEVPQMRAMADQLGVAMDEYVNMVPTIYGGPETLPAQSAAHLRQRKVFTGCHAGHTFYHVNPQGRASICKVGRDPSVSLVDEGAAGLPRLGEIADGLLLRQGGCTGCQLQGSCGTCMPLVQLYRKARAPLTTYCQHREREEVNQ